MKRLVIRLDDALHEQLRLHSLRTGEPLQRFAVRVLRAALPERDYVVIQKPRRRGRR